MALLIQRMIAPDLSFTMHTVNPISRNAGEAYVELAVGLGETLASAATRGNPWRLVCDKASSRTTMLAFANFSDALWPDSTGDLTRRIVDYSRMTLTQNSDLRRRLGARLAAIARAVEIELGRPQDIEGVITGEDIFLVQARPQQGLGG
jgi:phosphoglucan,water dikinase